MPAVKPPFVPTPEQIAAGCLEIRLRLEAEGNPKQALITLEEAKYRNTDGNSYLGQYMASGVPVGNGSFRRETQRANY